MRYVSDCISGTKIAVVGAGAMGAAIAYRLAQAGASVTVVERQFPGSGTSGHSFAWLNGFSKQPRDYQELNSRSVREHEALAAELNGDWLHADGGLHWIHDGDAEAAEKLHRTVRRLREWGYRVDRTTPDVVVRELEPDLAIDGSRVSEVFVFPNEGWLHAVRMAHALLHAATTQFGAELISGVVVGFERSARGVSGIVLEDGRAIGADIVVNCAGPNAATVAELAGAALPMRRHVGALVGTEPAPVCVRHVVRAPQCNVRPDGGGRLLVHREVYDSAVTEETLEDIEHAVVTRAMADLQALMPGVRGIRAESMRIGVRPMPLDGYPIVGFEPDVPGLYEAVTHSGITLCAILARLITEELSGGAVPELAPYRPDRFKTSV